MHIPAGPFATIIINIRTFQRENRAAYKTFILTFRVHGQSKPDNVTRWRAVDGQLPKEHHILYYSVPAKDVAAVHDRVMTYCKNQLESYLKKSEHIVDSVLAKNFT